MKIPANQNAKVHPSFRSDIEGLRAVAILLVVGYHAHAPGFSGGYVGVDVFFVLSGYLITSLLVNEMEISGKIDLIKFYARRSRRLLPALTLVLFTTIVVGSALYSPVEQRWLATTALSTASYISNVYFVMSVTDYLGADAQTNPLLHTWSLSVEEQFYLAWPLLVMFALGDKQRQPGSATRGRLVLAMLAISVASFVVSVWLTEFRQPWAFFLSPTRAWEFAVGGLGVRVPQLGTFLPSAYFNGRTSQIAVNALGWMGLGVIIFSGVIFNKATPFPGTAALLPVLATVAVLRAGVSRSKLGITPALSAKPLQEIGRISYSWYLWHWPVLVFAEACGGELTLAARLALAGVSFAFAELSYRFVENPIRHSPFLARRPLCSLTMAATIAVTGVSLSTAWRHLSKIAAESPAQVRYTDTRYDIPSLYASRCHADFYDVKISDCVFAARDSRTTVVLFGDSHAAQWFPALLAMSQEKKWRLVSLTKSACPPVDAPPQFNQKIGREYRECDDWRQAALKRIRETRPTVVVTSSSTGYPFSRDEWLSGSAEIFAALSRVSGYVVLLRDTPEPGFNIPTCLARATWRSRFIPMTSCDFEKNSASRQDIYDIQERAATPYKNVFFVDLTDHICPGRTCRAERGKFVVYRDEHHLTASYSASLTPKLAEELDQIVTKHHSIQPITLLVRPESTPGSKAQSRP